MAPGSEVVAAWHQNLPIFQHDVPYSDFNIMSGASIACALAAGVAVFLKGLHSNRSQVAIRSSIITPADIVNATFEPIQDNGNDYQPASSLAIGAGFINANQALDLGLIYDATPKDSELLVLSIYEKHRVSSITKLETTTIARTHLPILITRLLSYFIVMTKFQWIVTNVGKDTTKL